MHYNVNHDLIYTPFITNNRLLGFIRFIGFVMQLDILYV
jgi:hypothetical protein